MELEQAGNQINPRTHDTNARLSLNEKMQLVKDALGTETIDMTPEEIEGFLVYLASEQDWAEVYRRLADS